MSRYKKVSVLLYVELLDPLLFCCIPSLKPKQNNAKCLKLKCLLWISLWLTT